MTPQHGLSEKPTEEGDDWFQCQFCERWYTVDNQADTTPLLCLECGDEWRRE